jgi:epoxyqueuosine reductase
MESPWKTELGVRARAAGFLDVRIADARPDATAAAAYREWVEEGYHGEMAYLERLMEERTSGLDHVLPGARAILMFAASYFDPGAPVKLQDVEADGAAAPGAKVRVARYALGVDYHYILKERLAPLIAWLDSSHPGHQWRAATDSAPIMERTYAAAAGLGFIGKNGMLITWLQGSFTLLASIVTTAPLPADPPRKGTCGQCTRCLDACPTQAFIRPGQLDARRCISYLTIEKKSQLTIEEAAATGEWAFGCDICQEVCPYNKAPAAGTIEDFAAGKILHAVEPAETFLAAESNGQFEKRFAGSPVLRPGRRRVQGLIRSKQPDIVGALDKKAR